MSRASVFVLGDGVSFVWDSDLVEEEDWYNWVVDVVDETNDADVDNDTDAGVGWINAKASDDVMKLADSNNVEKDSDGICMID